MNPKVIRIAGRFYLPGYSQPVIISPDSEMTFPGGLVIDHLMFDMTKSEGGVINFGN